MRRRGRAAAWARGQLHGRGPPAVRARGLRRHGDPGADASATTQPRRMARRPGLGHGVGAADPAMEALPLPRCERGPQPRLAAGSPAKRSLQPRCRQRGLG